MEEQTPARLGGTPEIRELFEGDPLFERVQEINERIARRAYELFAASGFLHGHHHEHWLRAESEILHAAPLDVTETETDFTVRTEVPGFSEKDLEVRADPRCLIITGNREEEPEGRTGRTVYSERQSSQVFRLMNLPARIDTDGVKATLSDGILVVHLRKAGMAKKIPVLARAAFS